MSRRRTLISSDDTLDGYEYVDMGLPSGTLWAKYNIGATSERMAGDLFQFGDINNCNNHPANWENYIYYTGNTKNYSKYNTTDGFNYLKEEDDAANYIMGGSWFVPSWDEFSELTSTANTTATGETIGSYILVTLTSKINGNEISFYGCGYKNNTNMSTVNQGLYMTGNLPSSPFNLVRLLQILFSNNQVGYGLNNRDRCYGYLIRPVNRINTT